MKVIREFEDSYPAVVEDRWGEQWIVGNTAAVYEPIPLCRVPFGHGRTEAEAVALAQKIAAFLTREETCPTKPS